MTKSFALFIFCMNFFVSYATAKTTPTKLHLSTEEYPPYSYPLSQDSRLAGGLVVDKILGLLKDHAVDTELRIFPWKRAYQRALDGVNHCVFSTARTPERESLFLWFGPVVNVEWAFLAKEGTPAASISSLSEAKKFLIGGLEGDASLEALQKQGFKTESVVNNWLNKEKLQTQRIQLWMDDPAYVDYELRKNKDAHFKYKKVHVLQHSDLYLACNKKLSLDLIPILKRLNP